MKTLHKPKHYFGERDFTFQANKRNDTKNFQLDSALKQSSPNPKQKLVLTSSKQAQLV